jgi:hypothetical protein
VQRGTKSEAERSPGSSAKNPRSSISLQIRYARWRRSSEGRAEHVLASPARLGLRSGPRGEEVEGERPAYLGLRAAFFGAAALAFFGALLRAARGAEEAACLAFCRKLPSPMLFANSERVWA